MTRLPEFVDELVDFCALHASHRHAAVIVVKREETQQIEIECVRGLLEERQDFLALGQIKRDADSIVLFRQQLAESPENIGLGYDADERSSLCDGQTADVMTGHQL